MTGWYCEDCWFFDHGVEMDIENDPSITVLESYRCDTCGKPAVVRLGNTSSLIGDSSSSATNARTKARRVFWLDMLVLILFYAVSTYLFDMATVGVMLAFYLAFSVYRLKAQVALLQEENDDSQP